MTGRQGVFERPHRGYRSGQAMVHPADHGARDRCRRFLVVAVRRPDGEGKVRQVFTDWLMALKEESTGEDTTRGKGGSGWESNPPWLARRYPSTVFKTAEATGSLPPPRTPMIVTSVLVVKG